MSTTTSDLKKLFKTTSAMVEQTLLDHKIPYETNFGVPYFWDDSYIDKDVFDDLNCDELLEFDDLKDQLEKIKSTKDFKKVIKKEHKKELKKLKKKLDEEKQFFSTMILERLEAVWFTERKTKYIIHVGPTNSGKTYNAIQSLVKSGNGIYLAPLRLLAWEIYDKLKNTYEVPCNLVTGEERIYEESTDNTITSATIEMCGYDKYYDTVVIDEAFMLSDDQRGKAWLKAIMETRARTIHIISSLDSLSMIEELLVRTGKEYEVCSYNRKVPLVISDNPVSISKKSNLSKCVYVVFSRAKAIQLKSWLEKGNTKVSILYGALPPETKKQQMDLFIKGETTVCVSTDVIGMGVNLPCDNIIFTEIKKFDGTVFRDLLPHEAKQIGGRAGRFGLSEKGTIWGTNHVDIKYLKKVIDISAENEIAYCGIDFHVLKMIDKPSMKERITFYSKLNFIPEVLKNIVVLEDTKFLLELSSFWAIDKVELETAWEMIRLPVCDNNKELWKDFCSQVAEGNRFELPDYIHEGPTPIIDQNRLKEVEELISGIDLMNNIHNNPILKYYLSEDFDADALKEIKWGHITHIDNFLINKKAFSKKKCLCCDAELPMETFHKLCDECYDEQSHLRSSHKF